MHTVVSREIEQAVEVLNKGGVVPIPTETVYGLAGNIFDENAIKNIFNLKQRPLFNPLIVHIHSFEQLDVLVENIPSKAMLLAEAFWPGPLTMIFKKKTEVPDLVTAGKDTVAIRMPAHPVTQELLKSIEFPLAAPSANPFGSISPTSAQHVAKYFDGQIPLVLDGGNCDKGLESTIVGFEEEDAIVFRLGSISLEDISKVIGPVKILNKKEDAPDAPGMLARHYAPNTPTILVDYISEYLSTVEDKKIGVILFKEIADLVQSDAIEILSINGNLEEAAANLYAAMHRLDSKNLDLIVAERLPNHGLGKAINDRLERATKGN